MSDNITPENAINLHDQFDEVLYGDASCDNDDKKPGGKTDICGIGGVWMKKVVVNSSNKVGEADETVGDEGMDVDMAVKAAVTKITKVIEKDVMFCSRCVGR